MKGNLKIDGKKKFCIVLKVFCKKRHFGKLKIAFVFFTFVFFQ